jgi:hypothetical protein
MSKEPNQPFHESNLGSTEYRQRLMRKLNCLIAVLEVAAAKVRRGLAGPEPDVERLTKIQSNLTNTLEVCRRARRALERRETLPPDLPVDLAEAVREVAPQSRAEGGSCSLPEGASIEMGSPEEQTRFEQMGRISPQVLAACDLDVLAERLTR